MGDVGETFKALKEHQKAKRANNLANADDTGWNKHTPYHWSRNLNDSRLGYWPSKNKFMYKGKVMNGDVNKFIAKRLFK